MPLTQRATDMNSKNHGVHNFSLCLRWSHCNEQIRFTLMLCPQCGSLSCTSGANQNKDILDFNWSVAFRES